MASFEQPSETKMGLWLQAPVEAEASVFTGRMGASRFLKAGLGLGNVPESIILTVSVECVPSQPSMSVSRFVSAAAPCMIPALYRVELRRVTLVVSMGGTLDGPFLRLLACLFSFSRQARVVSRALVVTRARDAKRPETLQDHCTVPLSYILRNLSTPILHT